MASDQIDVRRPSFLHRAWISIRDRTLALADHEFLTPVLDGFRMHGWSGKVFLGLTGLSMLGSIGGAVIVALRESGYALPVVASILGVIPSLLLQWWFLKSLARFGNGARTIAIIGCTLGLVGSVVGLFSSDTFASIVTSFAGFGVMLQSLLYFRSGDYEERAAAFRELYEAAKPEEA